MAMAAALFALSCGRGGPESRAPESAAPEEAVPPVAVKVGAMFDEALTAISGGEIGRGAATLLDITLVTGPETERPAGFAEQIELARAGFASDDTAAGLDHVAAALKIWDPDRGEEFVAPGSETEGAPAPVAELFKDRITAAKGLMMEGDAKAGVASILEALLLLGPARAS